MDKGNLEDSGVSHQASRDEAGKPHLNVVL